MEVHVKSKYLNDIADSIRAKIKTSAKYKLSDMSQAIDSIEQGSSGEDFYITDGSYLFLQGLRTDALYGLLGKVKNLTAAICMFSYCEELETLDVSGLDTSKVTSMMNMFEGCSKLKTLDISNFDTSNVTQMDGMFSDCSNLEEINLGNINTSKVESMNGMFRKCSKLASINLEKFDTSTVEDFQNVFSGCSNLESLDVSGFNTSSGTRFAYMFDGCSKLSDIDVSNFDLSNSTSSSTSYMFGGCTALSENSLNGILKMFQTATQFSTKVKTLRRQGLSSDQATLCTTLSNWPALEDAGWTTGNL